MKITDEILSNWSKIASTDLCKHGYDFMKNRLENLDFIKSNSQNFEIYLQGSYANHTNIRRESDIDIVLQYNGVFRYDDSKLDALTKLKRNNAFKKADMTFEQFKTQIYQELYAEAANYKSVSGIKYKAKSIKISLQNPSIDVDVVPCFLYKNYWTFSEFDPLNPEHYEHGISLNNTDTGDYIINYPKLHKENGEDKNGRTGKNYKVTIRYIKKIKSLLVDKGTIDEKLAPSYFIENLLFNVPDNLFDGKSYLATFYNILNYLFDTTRYDAFLCQHKQWKLFGNSNTQWNKEDAKQFVGKLIEVYQGRHL